MSVAQATLFFAKNCGAQPLSAVVKDLEKTEF